MKTFFATHSRTFSAEWQKLKRTGIFWLCLGTALFIPVINTLGSFFMDADVTDVKNRWADFLQSNLGEFTSFFFPLFLVITMVRLVYLEHRSDTWKLMETQPVSRLSLFLVKFEVGLLVSVLSLFCLVGFALIGGNILSVAKPESGFSKSVIPWTTIFSVLVRFWIASFSLLAIQYFLSLLIKSFAWPMIIGLIGTIVGAMLAGFKIWSWFPYSALVYTRASYNGSNVGGFLLHHEKLSLVWAALFLWLGYQLFVRRGFVAAYLRPGKQVLQTAGALVVFGILFWIITTPIVAKPYGKTVIAGTIQTEKAVQDVQLLQAPAFDVVMSGKVTDGKFHLTSPSPLEKGMYYLRVGSSRMPIYFGANDSLHVDWVADKYKTELKFGGSRMAENEFLKDYNPGTSYLINFGYTMTPKAYSAAVMDRWKSENKEIDGYKTVDNVRPAADFIALQKKLLAVELLRLLDVEYPKSFAVYYPNDTLQYSKSIEALRKEIKPGDTTLIGNEKFVEYLYSRLQLSAMNTYNHDSAFFTAVKAIPSARLRDALLFKELESRMGVTMDSIRRNDWLQQWLPAVQNAVYRQQITETAQRMNRLQKGRPAPGFASESKAGKDFSLASLSRRYVVIDVWATWCGPCKREKPYFDQLAERYTSENVAFVSLSVDEDKDAWRRGTWDASKRVLQLWAKNAAEDFGKSYAIAAIPRFMLIDSKGRIANAQLPPPSDPEFEAILRREIPFLDNY